MRAPLIGFDCKSRAIADAYAHQHFRVEEGTLVFSPTFLDLRLHFVPSAIVSRAREMRASFRRLSR